MDEIIHAWEDVKAMFNGGTRKRIISSAGSESRDLSRRSQPLPPSAIPIKKSKEMPTISASSTSSSSTTTNVQSPQYPMRPLNFSSSNANTQVSPTIANSTPPVLHINPPPLRAPSSFPQELPFSLSARSFMIDYMWHQQQSSTSINAPTVANKASNHFQFPPYSALNWIKQPQSFLFKPSNTNEDKPTSSSTTNFNHFHSAFKPVINSMRLNDETVANGAQLPVQSPASSTSSSNYNQTTNQSDDEHPLTPSSSGGMVKRESMKEKSGRQLLKGKEVDYYIDVDERVENGDEEMCSDDDGDRSGSSKNQMTSDDENEMVDIETTEDDVQILNLQPANIHKRVIDDEIEISGDEKNNNLENYDERRSKSPIKSLKDIVSGSDEFFMTKRNRLQTSYEWSQGLNLKKEVSRIFQLFFFHRIAFFQFNPI